MITTFNGIEGVNMLSFVAFMDHEDDCVRYDLEFNGDRVAVEQHNDWDEDNRYYESHTVYVNTEPIVLYDEFSDHIDWYIFKIPEGFDYESFRKEVMEDYEIDLLTK